MAVGARFSGQDSGIRFGCTLVSAFMYNEYADPQYVWGRSRTGKDHRMVLTLELQEQHHPPRLSRTETVLLQQIELGLSQETWQRYHELIDKRRAEALSRAEQQELISLSDRLEIANARRMGYLAELARLRRIPLPSLMDELGIQAPSYV
jgi:hypothetical protein